ncbi:E3 SUMO-protein ligase RanBP2 [Anopheles nili]|uniref:E3 SUMO-protein ligase RanBP2 n=1 Tax=Anopheles nili TaxID=185578 RepID=UPI00237A8356|nr:E3 SUMO-protein ligase RanBP2 [Anopheles nili]
MFSTKKDIDRHVKTSLNKLPENERYLRGLAIARQYFKLNEYASAEHWLSCYLSVQEDSAPAHKLLGQCYEKQQKFDRAITSYQRSLQLDSKQTGLITDVCKLLLMDDNLTKHLSKAKHWCDLAESERINHEAVLNLKLKVANKGTTTDNKLVKDIILKEILARPLDPALRVRLVDLFLEEKKLDEAFKYCFELEMKFCEPFMQSIEWTNAIANMLATYTKSPGGGQQKNWNYYLLQAIVLDRQIYLNLLVDSTMEAMRRSNLKEIAFKLLKLDETLREVSERGLNAAPQKQMADSYLQHYRGQLLLHSAALLFKSAQEQSGAGRSRENNKKCYALLLLAYQCGVPDPDGQWLKQGSEMARQLLAFWHKQAAFRCCQAGSTLLSCVEEGVDTSQVLVQIQSVTETKVWTTADDLINQIRQLCSDPEWRQNVARSLYPARDISSKAVGNSYFVHESAAFQKPKYVLPTREQLEPYLELAQSLYPSSLPHLVYLGLALGIENLATFRCKAFPRLNFSTNNLNNCNLETLNQLDMDSFLYCSIVVAKSNMDHDRQISMQQQGRPAFLPAANLIPGLCEDNKINWWSAAYHLIKSSTAKDAAASVADQRQLLQHGLQAIRSTGIPLCDAIVLLKLGQVLAKRASESVTVVPEERRYCESRAEAVYRAGVLLWKMHNESTYTGGIESSGLVTSGYGSEVLFKYGIKPYDCQQEAVKLAESAITFLAGVYFKHGRHEQFTLDFGGIPLPFAAYFRAEAFKKLDESAKTPLKAKKFYSERARECIRQTQRYLVLPYIESNHPLNYVVQSEIKRLSFANDSFDGTLNTSANGGACASADDSDHFQSFTSSMTNAAHVSGGIGGTVSMARMSDRETATAAATAAASVCLAKTNDLEGLIRQMMETLTFVKEDVLGIRNDVGDMQDRLVKIEENIFRKSTEPKPRSSGTVGGSAAGPAVNDPASVSTAAAAAAMQAMNDIYMLDDLQSSALAYQQAAIAAAAAARAPVMGGVGMAAPQQATGAIPYHALYPITQHQQMLTTRGHPTGPMGASPMHTGYPHHADNLLVSAAGSPAAGVYHHPAFQPAVPPPAQPQADAVPTMHTGGNLHQISTPTPTIAKPAGIAGNLSIEQSLQTPTLLSSWNSTYNNSFNMPSVATPTVVGSMPSHLSNTTDAKGGAPVNVVITSSDPLPPQPNVNSSTFASGLGVQPTYSVTIPPQHIKHSTTGASIGQGTGGLTSTSKLETISPATANTKFPMQSNVPAGMGVKPQISTPVPVVPAALTPSFFANVVSPAKEAGDANHVEHDDDDDNSRNVSGGAEYDPRPDFQPIIPLPDEIEVRTGEEDEEQIFTGRSKLLRLVDREWKERGLGELKILRSKADLSKYRIVMRREQVHKICANHYITPELIIKPMEKLKQCYIWAAVDFADEEPRKESFCARFGTASLADEFYHAFVKARDEVARLRASDGSGNAQQTPTGPPPITTGSFSFSSTPKTTATITPAQPQGGAKPFGEFTFAKNYTPPSVGTKANATPKATDAAAANSKPSPFASFAFKAQQQGGSAAPFGNIFGGLALGGPPALGFDEKDFKCIHEAIITSLKHKDQHGTAWTDDGVVNGRLRLLTSATAVRLLLRRECDTNSAVCLSHVLDKDTRMKPTEKNGCSWNAQQDAIVTGSGSMNCMAYFKTSDDRDRFVAAVQKVLGSGESAVPTKAAADGFGDLFKPKTGSWDCQACYLNNKTDDILCRACNEPRDPSKKDDTAGKPNQASGGLFGSLAPPAEGSNKFTFGMPSSSGSAAPITFGSGTSAATSKKPQEPPKVTSTPAKSTGTTVGFGDQFKPKPGSWTCNGCYLPNGADSLFCMSCESPKDDTVPKKSASTDSAVSGLLKVADTAPKFNFAAGGGFTFGMPSSASVAPAASAVTPTVTSTASQQQPAFGGGFTFDSSVKPLLSTTDKPKSTAVTPEKPVFKFELPTPAGGLSFGSKLTSSVPAGTGNGANNLQTAGSPALNRLDPPEKATFGFVFKPKSPGRTLSGDGGDAAEGDDGAADESSVMEEENNTYFAPVIPLPDKVDVKTGEEDEDVLYVHRAKLYRFISSEWKERGIGDVKILKHKASGQLRVVMRREQVLKICLNHVLTEDICYTKKDDKSWQFVANDFSEGNFEIMNFSLRFKSSDIAQEFRDAIAAALSGKLSATKPSEGSGAFTHDSTVTSTTSPIGDLNFSKLSDISLNDREMAQQLKLPENFFEVPANPCPGCRGCDSDTFVFPVVDVKQLIVNDTIEGDDAPLPLNLKNVKPLPPVVANNFAPAKLSFGTATGGISSPFSFGPAANAATSSSGPMHTTITSGGGLISGLSMGAPLSVGGTAASTTASFLSTEQKSSLSSFTPAASSIFGGLQTSSVPEQTAGTIGASNKFNFGSSAGIGSASTVGSIFSASLNTTPKNSFISPPAGVVSVISGETDSKKEQQSGGGSAKPITSSPLLQPSSLSAAKPVEGGNLFSSVSFGSGGFSAPATVGNPATNIFGGTAGLFSAASSATTTVPSSTPSSGSNATLFGSVAGGDTIKSPLSFGALGDGFTFGSLAKQTQLAAMKSDAASAKNNVDAPSVFNMAENISFATIASSNSPDFSNIMKKPVEGQDKSSGGYVGLVVKEDFFSRSASGKLNNNTGGAISADKNNGNEEDGGGAGVGTDENYDPYYAPVIQLPDEIEVRTGEEEESKMFGERAKLYRFDTDTKEWKERGVGELKILHHPVRNTYRFLLRREQIHKLVLNQAITVDMSITPLNGSEKAFTWAGMNHAEAPGQLESLATRFKNEAIASEFRTVVENCQENLRSRPDLEPDQD